MFACHPTVIFSIWIKGDQPQKCGSGTYEQPLSTRILKTLFQYATLDEAKGISELGRN